MHTGIFITFEGIEGCGKSYQSKTLYRKLLGSGRDVILTLEPGGTPLGNAVRNLLKKTKHAISPLTELFLFNASRSQLINDVIGPALASGKAVICDRFTDSTVVYQGYGRGLDTGSIEYLNNIASGGMVPALTFLLDLPAEAGLERKKQRHTDRFDDETLEFHRRIREGFLELAGKDMSRWVIIDGLLSKKEISKIIWERVQRLFQENRAE
jgi:dTMP kinase